MCVYRCIYVQICKYVDVYDMYLYVYTCVCRHVFMCASVCMYYTPVYFLMGSGGSDAWRKPSNKGEMTGEDQEEQPFACAVISR